MNLRKKAGRVILPWLFILLMLSSLFWLLNRIGLGRMQTTACQQNLRAVYKALQLYELENGKLPVLPLFPEDVRADADSILNVLGAFGLEESMLLCPSAPRSVREHGIGYLWNPAVNGASLQDRAEATWLLVDIQALDDQLPGPHFGNYLILYTDGNIDQLQLPPRSLPVEYESAVPQR